MVSTQESMKKLLEKIPQCQLNGERVDCRFASRQNYAVFEAIANKRKITTSRTKNTFLLSYHTAEILYSHTIKQLFKSN